jgi:hypothetical protein
MAKVARMSWVDGESPHPAVIQADEVQVWLLAPATIGGGGVDGEHAPVSRPVIDLHVCMRESRHRAQAAPIGAHDEDPAPRIGEGNPRA